jgi:iron complex outermembrane receptor protein
MNTKRLCGIIVGCQFCFGSILNAQTTSSDTTKLDEVTVRAYGLSSRLKNIPAAINHISASTLERFSPASIVSAINTTPGVRMEERSPGSYRFNIRGSSLRSPFGVRNVKVYYNDIPITNPGGHTYLNQLGYYNFNSIDIIKGPGSSFYGAGTGGVLLIESLDQNQQPGLFTEYATGSYNLQNIYGSYTTRNQKLISKIGFQHQQNDGYRDHSMLKRDVHSWNGLFQIGENRILKTTFLFGNLYYQTPGALTKAEYDKNPRAARPTVGNVPGSDSAHASITQKTFLTGVSYEQQWLSKWSNKSSVYGMFTDLRNPTIRDYEHSSEPHLGLRTDFKFTQPLQDGSFIFDAGGELQEGFTTLSVYNNVGGNGDSLKSFDDINNRLSFVFTQASYESHNWEITAGGSFNYLRVKDEKFNPTSSGLDTKKYTNQIAPRLAILKKFEHFNIYTSVAKGYSPPTTEELFPSGSDTVNLNLNAEQGINYDLGFKGTIWKNLYIDINAFIFSLKNTIVTRRTAAGGDYYINAGKTKQHGIETYISYPLFQSTAFIDRSIIWLSHTWHDFHYSSFKQLNTDYSGNQLPGEAPHTISTGYDFIAKNGLLGTVSYFYSDKIPLNDANSAYADSYNLIGLKLGYQYWIKQKFRAKLIAGVDNLLNEKYSLGNDINGFGGRYYNAAPGRNYYVSIVFQFITKNNP